MLIRRLLGAALAAGGVIAGGVAAGAQAVPFDQIAAALGGVHQFAQVALSPDGRRFVYVEVVGDRSAIRLADVAKPGAAHTITACPGRRCDEGDVAWSPDGRQLAFVTTDARGQGQVAVEDFAGSGGARVVTAAKGPLSTPRWSPDGTRLAFLYSAGAPRPPSPLGPASPASGVIGSTFYEQRLAVISALPAIRSGPAAIRLLGPVDLNVYEFDWSPDGTRFAATAAHGNGDANWWVAELYTIDERSGSAARIHHPELQIASPRWSRDGKRIAYIGGIMSDEAITGGDVYVVAPAGGDAIDVTPNLKASVVTIAWNGSRNGILATELAGDRMVIAQIDPDAKRQHQVWTRAGDDLRERLRRHRTRRRGRVVVTRRKDCRDDPAVDHVAAGDRDRAARRDARGDVGERAPAPHDRAGAQHHVDRRR